MLEKLERSLGVGSSQCTDVGFIIFLNVPE